MVHTRQRQAIFEVLKEAGRPLTRDEILALARRKVSRIGSATVDRNIREMRCAYQLIGVDFPGQPQRYELPSDREHPHFVCRTCNKVYDLPIHLEMPQIDLPKGFHLIGGEVIYTGFCPECAPE